MLFREILHDACCVGFCAEVRWPKSMFRMYVCILCARILLPLLFVCFLRGFWGPCVQGLMCETSICASSWALFAATSRENCALKLCLTSSLNVHRGYVGVDFGLDAHFIYVGHLLP